LVYGGSEDHQRKIARVTIMRDFLTFWEGHEQAKSRTIFINHAGSGN
jgi:hypothetical protein